MLALRRLDTQFTLDVRNFFASLPRESHSQSTPEKEDALLSRPLDTIRISSSLIDTNLNSPTQWLNPLDPTSGRWARAFWLAWWTQDTTLRVRLKPPPSYDQTLYPRAYELSIELCPKSVRDVVVGGRPAAPLIRTADGGMQDTAGAVLLLRPLLDTSSLAGVATLVQ